VLGATPARATLAYGQPLTGPGLHLVATESDHWVENLAGLGGCGAHVLMGLVGDSPQQGHPLLPVVQVAAPGALATTALVDVDAVLTGDVAVDAATLHDLLVATVQRERQPVANAGGFVDFQLSRGLLGVST
jgi:altronate dehydratase